MNGAVSNPKIGDNLKRKQNSNTSKHNAKKFKNNVKFEFGNYNQYYGYRNVNECTDTRIEIFQSRKELFKTKDILDIGCNIGHITYIIARDLTPKSILGIDIDDSLIKIARKNLRHYHKTENLLNTSNDASKSNCQPQGHDPALLNGNHNSTSQKKTHSDEETKSTTSEQNMDPVLAFPNNVSFIHGNYVLDHDNLLSLEEARYDVILCLSVTKWIQLNWGDDGLKRVFKRVYAQLRIDGIFILESQPWESYRKKKLSAKLRQNCRNIKFYPNMFHEYLLSEVGFTRSEVLAVPSHSSKGFQRPVKVYYK